MSNRSRLLLGVLLAAPLATACGGGSGGGVTDVAVTGVQLNKHQLSLTAGTSERLVATVLPADATHRNVTWSIDEDANLSVLQDGTVIHHTTVVDTAVVTVTTEEGGFTDSCTVTVEARAGEYRYVAAGSAGLKIMDVRWPDDPHLEATQATRGTAEGVFVSGDYAYVAESGAGLEIFDVADPDAPSKVGECATSGWQDATAVWVEGDVAYVADGAAGLTVIDVADRSTPVQIGHFDTDGTAIDVAVSGGRAYVADRNGGLAILDVADPSHPALITRYDAFTSVNGVVAAGDRVWLADSGAGLVVVDVSNPASPSVIGSCETPGFAQDLFVSGDHAYVADGTNGLVVIDLADPANPVVAGTYDTSGSALGVTAAEGYAYVADTEGGLVIVDVGDPAHPTLAGTYNFTNDPQGLDRVGDYIYVADDDRGLVVVGMLDEHKPSLVAALDTEGHAYDVAYWADHVYVADGSAGLEVIRVVVPGIPTLVETVSLGEAQNAQSVTVEDGKAYVSNGAAGLYVHDLSDPMKDQEFRMFTGRDQAVRGAHVFVAADLTPLVVVLTGADPDYWEFDLEESGIGRTSGVALYGNFLYLTSGAGVTALNVESPTAPVVVGGPWAVGAGGGGHVVADEDFLYVAHHSSGLAILNRTTGELVGYRGAGGAVRGLDVEGNRAYLCGDQGLTIMDIGNRADPTILFQEGRFLAVQ